MDIDTVQGTGYGNTLTWNETPKPATPVNKVHMQLDVDLPKLHKALIDMFSKPAPKVVPSSDVLTK